MLPVCLRGCLQGIPQNVAEAELLFCPQACPLCVWGRGVWREVFVDVHACVDVFMRMSEVNLRCCPLDIIFFFFE